MPFDVFISYAHQDKAAADAAVAALEARQIRCWVAPRDIADGATWAGAIVEAIDECRAMVLILSSHASGSVHVAREVHAAAENGLTIVPLRIEEVTPSGSLAYFINSLQWRDATSKPLEPHLDALGASLQAFLSGDASALDRPGVRAARFAGPDRRFSAPVGNVEANLGSEMLGFLPSHARLPRGVHLALTRLDRDLQMGAVADRLADIVKLRAQNMLLVILRGIRPDCHPGFVIRCAHVECQEILGPEASIDYLGQVRWQPQAKTVLPVLQDLAKALRFPPSCRSQDEIEERLSRHDRSICFSHFVDAADWGGREKALVGSWIDYLVKKWPATGPGCMTIAFLCLNFADRDYRLRRFISPRYWSLSRFGQKLYRGSGLSDGAVVVPERFDLVGRRHVEELIAQVGRELNQPQFEVGLIDAIDGIFPRPNQRRRYGDVYQELTMAIAESQQPQRDISFHRAGR